MGNVGGGEILVILLVALIFLGPEKLPEVARQVGKVVGEIRKVTSGFQREMQDAMRLIDDAAKETEQPRPVDAITLEAAAVEPVGAPVGEATEVPGNDPATLVDAASEPSDAPVADEPPMTDEAPVTSEAPPLPLVEEPVTSEAPPLPVAADDLPYDTAHGGDR